MKLTTSIIFFCYIIVMLNTVAVFGQNAPAATSLPAEQNTPPEKTNLPAETSAQTPAETSETPRSADTTPEAASSAPPVAAPLPTEVLSPPLDKIMEEVEKRYAGAGFTARFDQQSTLKAMEITDTAFGKVFIKRPGMMRWEYEAPEKQVIITDSTTLWIYRPMDNQVMTGDAPSYFKDGKGASFLSNMKIIRQNFDVTPEETDEFYYVVKLVPKEKKYDISAIYLSISKATFDVARIVTYNSYGDETFIEMSDFQFNQNLEDSLFHFTVPEGADILQLEE
jgi:outer membrane lipoprotein carrier protein